MKKKLIILVIFLVLFMIMPVSIYADMGAKPSIDIKIKNLNTTNYIVDLFVYDENGTAYMSEKNYNGEGLSEAQISKLYELNFDGWISESTRWNQYLLFAECAGNLEFENSFSYFGTPEKYKIVIINNDTGDIKISKEIIRRDFNSLVTIEYDTMNVIYEVNDGKKSFINIVVALIITVIVELLIAYIFKMSNYKIIAITNVITNLGLQVLLLTLINDSFLAFVGSELVVILTELIVYLCKFKNIKKVKTILYTLTANAITVYITMILK